jgi:hypothetical protein
MWRPYVSVLVILGILAALSVASCNGGDSDSGSATSSEQGDASSPGARDAKAAVVRLWSHIGSGSPTLTSEYDPKLIRLFGTNLILTVFDGPPPEYTAPLRVKEIRRVPSGFIVIGEGKGPGQTDPIRIGFLLGKSGGRWHVRYDSNLFNRVRGELMAQVRRRLPPTKETEERAAAVANGAILRARSLFAIGPRKGSLPPR